MIEKHTIYDVAINILPPKFIEHYIQDQTLVRDFIRGFLDGDGSFSGNIKEHNLRYQILGPKRLLLKIQELITYETGITSFITDDFYKVFIKNNKKEYRLYGKNQIYIKKQGFKELSFNELKQGIVEKRKHPYIKRLHISGVYNCVKFFNWLYENNDNFDVFEIQGIRICGRRKFQKALSGIGNFIQRKEVLAPIWSDVVYDIIPLLESKYYSKEELISLTNDILKQKLALKDLGHLYKFNKVNNPDSFAFKLKFLEFNEKVISHYKRKEGRFYRSYYYSLLNPPTKKPSDFFKHIEIVSYIGNLNKNIMNLIVLLYLLDNNWRKLSEIHQIIVDSGVYNRNTDPLSRIKLYLSELVSFNIIIIEDEELTIDEQSFLLNSSIIPKYYKRNLEVLKSDLLELFYK